MLNTIPCLPPDGATAIRLPENQDSRPLPEPSSVEAHRLPADWTACYGVEPLLLETLVDPTRYRGTCYRAANWIDVGMTQGRGRMDREHAAPNTQKQIFLYPLHRHWRQRLCDDANPQHNHRHNEVTENDSAGNFR